MLSRGISGTNVTRFGGIPVGLHSANFTNQICRTPIDLMVPHTGICAACVPAFRRDPFRGQPESIPRSSMSYGLICKASVQFARAPAKRCHKTKVSSSEVVHFPKAGMPVQQPRLPFMFLKPPVDSSGFRLDFSLGRMMFNLDFSRGRMIFNLRLARISTGNKLWTPPRYEATRVAGL